MEIVDTGNPAWLGDALAHPVGHALAHPMEALAAESPSPISNDWDGPESNLVNIYFFLCEYCIKKRYMPYCVGGCNVKFKLFKTMKSNNPAHRRIDHDTGEEVHAL